MQPGKGAILTPILALHTTKISQVMSAIETWEIANARIKHLSDVKGKDYILVKLDDNHFQSAAESLYPIQAPSTAPAVSTPVPNRTTPALNCSLEEITDYSGTEDDSSVSSKSRSYAPNTKIRLNIKKSADYYRNDHFRISLLDMFKLNYEKTDYSSDSTC